VSQSEKLSHLEERIGLYYQEEASRISIPQGLSQRIVEKAASPSAEKPTRRRRFRLLARGAMAAAATAALLVAALVIWANADLGTSTVSAAAILQRVEQNYQEGEPAGDIPVFGNAPSAQGPVEVPLPSYGVEVTELVPNMRELYRVDVTGEETLDGHDCYVLLATPLGKDELPEGLEPSPPADQIELWVDKETNLVHRVLLYFSTPEELEAHFANMGPPPEPAPLPIDLPPEPLPAPEEMRQPEPPPLPAPPPPGFTITPELAYATLLEDLSEVHEVTVTVVSKETIDNTIHYVLSMVLKPLPEPELEGAEPSPPPPIEMEVWVDAESGLVTEMEFKAPDAGGGGGIMLDSGPGQ
jgi:hypothetical protein